MKLNFKLRSLAAALVAVAAVASAPAGASAQNAADPIEGYWRSIDDQTNQTTGVWRVYVDTDGLAYAVIVWAAGINQGTLASACTKSADYVDFPRPGDPSKMLLLGTPWIYKVKREKRGVWERGRIIDPSDGNCYYCSLTAEKGKLVMRGSLDARGWMGRSQTWEPVSEQEAKRLANEIPPAKK